MFYSLYVCMCVCVGVCVCVRVFGKTGFKDVCVVRIYCQFVCVLESEHMTLIAQLIHCIVQTMEL